MRRLSLLVLFLARFSCVNSRKESRRRKLPIIADDNYLLSTRDRAKRINRFNLARLVNQYEIETDRART